MGELSADISKLVKAASTKNYATAKQWIERNNQYLSTQTDSDLSDGVQNSARIEITRMLQTAALDGQVSYVEYFRSYG